MVVLKVLIIYCFLNVLVVPVHPKDQK